MAMSVKKISDKLLKRPVLMNRVKRLLKIVDNQDGLATLADDAEERVIGENTRTWEESLGRVGER